MIAAKDQYYLEVLSNAPIQSVDEAVYKAELLYSAAVAVRAKLQPKDEPPADPPGQPPAE